MEMLGTSNGSFWLHDNLLEQQLLHEQTVPPTLHSFSGLPSEAMNSVSVSVGMNGYTSGAHIEIPNMAQPNEIPPQADVGHIVQPRMSTPEFSGRDAGAETSNPPSARKLQKADRERLRRDHLNEQFAKLADVLDPVRPKNDKGTILAESILTVSELRSEIARLRCEHKTLSDESRDLTQERTELREERLALETETGRLQEQLHHSADNQNVVPGWMGMDFPGLSTGHQLPYSLPVPSTMKFRPSPKDSPQDPTTKQQQKVPVPLLAMSPPSTFLHPAYQAYGMFSAGQAPFMNYNPFLHPGHHSHVERPAARYPSPIHPTPIYPGALSKSAQAKPADLPNVVTDLQLQTPGHPPPSAIQYSVPEPEQSQRESSKRVGPELDVLRDTGEAGDEQLAPRFFLTSNSITV